MQTGSSGTLIGWKSGQTTFVPLWDWMEGAWLRTRVHDSQLRSNQNLVSRLSVAKPDKLNFFKTPAPVLFTQGRGEGGRANQREG